MASKHKCRECANVSSWAIPCGVSEQNYEYAKGVLYAIQHTLCCNEKMLTRDLNHEIYCKKYCKTDGFGWSADKFEKERQDNIQKLEQMIKDYEGTLQCKIELRSNINE